MDEKNISFISGNTKFNIRVAIWIEFNGKVLLETNGKFWNMIGGRVHFGESTCDAVHRELKEELGVDISELELINVSENFFEWMGRLQQEILFVYRASIDDTYQFVRTNEFKCQDSDEVFKWHNKNDIYNLDCRPDIIKQLIKYDGQLFHSIKVDN